MSPGMYAWAATGVAAAGPKSLKQNNRWIRTTRGFTSRLKGYSIKMKRLDFPCLQGWSVIVEKVGQSL
jgi:hypothetical protein